MNPNEPELWIPASAKKAPKSNHHIVIHGRWFTVLKEKYVDYPVGHGVYVGGLAGSRWLLIQADDDPMMKGWWSPPNYGSAVSPYVEIRLRPNEPEG